MNRDNQTMLTSPNLSYTSRDFNSIYNELINSIPLLTKSWDAKDENDPGIVLIKLLSMCSDMLSYNLDKAALEAFPRTVLQKINAQQLFRLQGYKMHLYRSARVEASILNANLFPIHVARYNVFTSRNQSINYVNLYELEIPAGSTGVDNAYKCMLIQGTPVTPPLIGSVKTAEYNSSWHAIYDYNLKAEDISNDRIYLKYYNIDESSIVLIDNDERPFANNEWTLVNNINLVETQDKVFEFDMDTDGGVYIQLPSYWKEKYVITKFKLFLVLSDGSAGEIEENSLVAMSTKKVHLSNSSISVSSALQQVQLRNSPSTYGYGTETVVEARINAEKYINTLDTIITLRDFEKVVKRIDSVANVIATDVQMDPYPEDMENHQINLHIVRKSDYNNEGAAYIYSFNSEGNDSSTTVNNDELFKENIVNELKSYKTIPSNINIKLEPAIDWIDWTLSGQIFLRKPINIDQNNELMVKINEHLKNRFSSETLDFNEAINYMDAIECVMKADKNIWHVDLDTSAIKYSKARRGINGTPTGYIIKNKYMIYNENNEYTGYYATSLGCTTSEINKIYPFLTEEEINTMGINDITKSTVALNPITNMYELVSPLSNISPGGDGYSSGTGNRIVREDGVETVIGLFSDSGEPREYEIYNSYIWDWTGENPKFTGYKIDSSGANITLKKFNDDGDLEDTNYRIEYDSRMYAPNGSDANKYFVDSYQQITQLVDNNDGVIYTPNDIKNMTNEQLQEKIVANEIRETFDIYDRPYNEWTGESVDKLTGEIFVKRGLVWYKARRAYNESTGEITDINGPVLYDESYSIIKDECCKEDITGEYFQYYTVADGQKSFEFYLGQNAEGEPELDSLGKPIEAYPIKPYSLVIYINGDEAVAADDGSGKINGTSGLLNGYGSIDYSTGKIMFTTNEIPTSVRVSYKVNKFTYANYVPFELDKLFVRNEYIRNDYRK